VKTQSSDRTVRLREENVNLLRELLPLHPRPNDFFFHDVYGGPIAGGVFYNTFIRAQRSLGISPIRDLYSTKDTFLSVCITNRVDLAWLSSQTGVSEWTIKKHYGRFMHHPERDALELAKIKPPAPSKALPAAVVGGGEGISAVERSMRETGTLRARGALQDSARNGAVWTSIGPRRASNRQISRKNGGDGWESNPPRTLSALMRF
jgi:hypothetical protein